MIKTIEVSGSELKLAANAATPYRFKQIFHEDLFQIFQAASKVQGDNYELADTVTKLTYIMSKQADNADMNGLSEEDFLAWLERFAPMDLLMNSEEIIGFYMSTTSGSVAPKKK